TRPTPPGNGASDTPEAHMKRRILACHRLILRLYPKHFREIHAEEVHQLFGRVLSEEAPDTRLRRAGWALRLLLRSATAGLRLRWDHRRLRPLSTLGLGSPISGLRFALRIMVRQPGYALAAVC